jgi:hypothetical protein
MATLKIKTNEMKTISMRPEDVERFREYLKDAVIEARGAWDVEAALDALRDGEWLGRAFHALDIGDTEAEAIADQVYDEVREEYEAGRNASKPLSLPDGEDFTRYSGAF